MMRTFALTLALALALLAAPVARAEDAPKPPPAADAPAKTDAELADELFSRLGKTDDPEEAAGIIAAMERLWLRSGSDTSDLLMTRAMQAFGADDYSDALSLLDAIVVAQPDWAEGWNKRATVRFYAGDLDGSAADIAETLKRNPRHVGALMGLAAIFEQTGLKDQALQVYERALKIAPHYGPLNESADRLKAALSGERL